MQVSSLKKIKNKSNNVPIETEELEAREFLKRAEVRTMRKDLQKMREADALKEKDKIIKSKTAEQEKIEKLQKEKEAKENLEKLQREKILQSNVSKEREAEKQIKDYAEESEKQQIFLFESQRLALQKQIDDFEKEKEPELALQKNKILLEKSNWEARLKSIIGEEQKVESELKLISDKEKESNVPAEKKSLEQRRTEIENARQEIEKKRWAIEKELSKLDDDVKKTDEGYQKIIEEKDSLKQQITAIDGSLRGIYSKIINRVQERKRGQAEQQKAEALKAAEINAEKKENVQREQWGKTAEPKEKEFLKGISETEKEKLVKSFKAEEEQRQKFLKDVEAQSKEENKKII